MLHELIIQNMVTEVMSDEELILLYFAILYSYFPHPIRVLLEEEKDKKKTSNRFEE